ncbi:calmodulin [Angomonas deanei]|nr:calmodulin [Angomonas deanei]|eukprot:EPY40586.1 calmodulin [Angomonas deanei]
MRSLGHRHTEAEFRDLFKSLGEPITFEQFVHLMEQPYKGPTEEDLRTALNAFDANGSGKLKLSELVSLLSTLGEKIPEADVKQILYSCPSSGDGWVDIEAMTAFLVEPVFTVTPEIQELERQLTNNTTE